MCLRTKLSDRSLACYKAKGKKTGYIKVWKVVEDKGGKYYPEWYLIRGLFPKKGGLVCASKNATTEQQLIHAFRDIKSAKIWKWSYTIIVECMVHPDWIKALRESYKKECSLTTKAIVMPAYPKRKVTVKEFRAAIKGKKVQKYSWE